jgi:hypothetical protein
VVNVELINVLSAEVTKYRPFNLKILVVILRTLQDRVS